MKGLGGETSCTRRMAAQRARISSGALALACALTAGASAGELTVPLWPDGDPLTASLPNEETVVERSKDPGKPNRLIHHSIRPELTVHLPPTAPESGCPAVVICPGGAYRVLSIDKEGHQVAQWCNALGMAGIVLKYRMPRPDLTADGTPLPLMDAHRAIQIVRRNAGKWHIDPKKIGIMGFSAGGHLASSAATHAAERRGDALDEIDSRPDFLILVYAVISMQADVTHPGSRTNLLGKEPLPGMVDRFSGELHVTAGTPPTFLVSTDDDVVKIRNAELFHEACVKAGVPCKLQRYRKGGHGYGLGVNGGEIAEWPGRCREWLIATKVLADR